mmetsp:Transcript_29084/g.91049  ORF Transcript_29084/g.91049 Transcript_29084/m.91049 type:complete len:573 (+) Transcript_29084:1267-2985(+)
MVVGGVLQQPAVKVGPREEVDRVLLGADGARDHLGVDVIVELLVEARLDGEGLVQELLVEGLLWLVHEDDGDRLCVELRPAGAPHHLEHVRHREVDVPLRLAVVVLGPLDDDEVGGEVDAPREGRGADEDEDRLAEEELLDEDAVRLVEAGVVDTDPKGERVPQRRVLDRGEHRLELTHRHVEELALLLVRRAVGDQVERRQPRLAAARDEDEGRLVGRVDGDGAVGRLVHRRHARAVVLPREARDVHLEWHRPHRRLEVEDRVVRDAEPVGEVARVGHGGRESDDAHRLRHPLRHVPHARDDHLEDGPALLAEQVDLVDDDQRHLLHVVALLPVARDAVPLLGRRGEDVRRRERARVGRHVARQLEHLEAEPLHELGPPVGHPLAHQRLERRDVHRLAAGVLAQQPQHGQLGGDRLARAGRRSDEDVVVGVHDRVEDLRLHRVEVREAEERLEASVGQSALWQRSQREQVGVGRPRRRQREVRERERRHRLDAEPAVGEGADVVRGREGLEERRGEAELLRLERLLLGQGPQLLVVDVLRVRVLHPDPPRLCAAVQPVAPLEGGRQREHDA